MSGPMTRLLLARHGEADMRGRFLQHACEGLTEVGMRQAGTLADRLATSGEWEVDAVVVSKAARAIQTGEVVADRLGVRAAMPTCDLCEMHPGNAEGFTNVEMCERWGPSYADVPGAEPYSEWVPRARGSLLAIARTYEGQTVVCVTHNAVDKASFEVFGRMPRSEAVATERIANTAITEWATGATVDWANDASDHAAWALVRHNDASHLGRLEHADRGHS